MKKTKTGTFAKLSLNKKTIIVLHQQELSYVAGGEGSQASACYSCMSQCLCNPPQTAPGNPCCELTKGDQ